MSSRPRRSLLVPGVLSCLASLPAMSPSGVSRAWDPGGPSTAPSQAIQGFAAVSTIRYASAPETPRRLEATYALPDRARLWIDLPEGPAGARELFYRSGDRLYLLPPGSTPSRELADGERARALGAFELRRALMCWPEGFEWRGEGASRETDLGAPGVLRAQLGTDGKPADLAWHDPEGALVEEFSDVRWHEIAGRSWPHSMQLKRSAGPVWTETVEKVDTGTRFIDSYFVPPDRRTAASASPADPSLGDLPAQTRRSIPLKAGLDWREAIFEERQIRGEWLERLRSTGLVLADRAAFELDAHARPVAVILRLDRPRELAPEGWESLPARKGLTVFCRGAERLDARVLVELRARVPDGGRPGSPYAVLAEDAAAGGQVQVVLPFHPPD